MFFLNGAMYGAWATQIPLVTSRLGISDQRFGLMLMAMSGGAIAAMCVSAFLIRVLGMRPILLVSAVILFLSFLPLVVLVNHLAVVICMAVFGAAAGLFDVACNAFAADVETRMSKHVMSSIHGMWSIGGLVAAGLGSCLLFIVNGFTQALIITALLAVIFAGFQARLISVGVTTTALQNAKGRAGGQALFLGVLAALGFAVEGAVRDWSALYLRDDLGVPIAIASWGFSAFSLVMAIGRFFGDRLRSRFGSKLMVSFSALAAAFGFLVVVSLPALWAAIIGFGLAGLGLSNVIPILISVAGQLRSAASSIALVVAFGYGGYLASPPAFGAIAGETSLTAMFLVIAFICASMAAIWSIYGRGRKIL
jgi:MFS family permease